jgi:hypothetical protein
MVSPLAEHHGAAPHVQQFGRAHQRFALRARNAGEPRIAFQRRAVRGRKPGFGGSGHEQEPHEAGVYQNPTLSNS